MQTIRRYDRVKETNKRWCSMTASNRGKQFPELEENSCTKRATRLVWRKLGNKQPDVILLPYNLPMSHINRNQLEV